MVQGSAEETEENTPLNKKSWRKNASPVLNDTELTPISIVSSGTEKVKKTGRLSALK